MFVWCVLSLSHASQWKKNQIYICSMRLFITMKNVRQKVRSVLVQKILFWQGINTFCPSLFQRLCHPLPRPQLSLPLLPLRLRHLRRKRLRGLKQQNEVRCWALSAILKRVDWRKLKPMTKVNQGYEMLIKNKDCVMMYSYQGQSSS